MALETTNIHEKITQKFGTNVLDFQTQQGIFSFEATSDVIHDVIRFLKEDADLNFHFLTDLCGIHYPHQIGKELGVVYHVHSLIHNLRIRIKCFMPTDQAFIPSITSLYSAANWQERETFDFYGIIFNGHPNLKRILNVDEMDYFPLRKEYPLEDGTRTDKDDTYFGR